MRRAAVLALAVAAVTASLATSPARAQEPGDTERLTVIGRDGKVRTKITVRPRSYLDGGTEVIPGERKFTDYANPPTYLNGSPSAAWDPTGARRGGLPYYSPYSAF